jgi:hypothetical protein
MPYNGVNASAECSVSEIVGSSREREHNSLCQLLDVFLTTHPPTVF